MLSTNTVKVNRPRQQAAGIKATQARAPWTSDRGPTDAEIEQIAAWYAEQQHGSYVLLSDSLDHGWN